MPRRRPASNQPLTAGDARQAIADRMLEAELQANVRQVALANGWMFYHTRRSDRSDEGFPDCVMIRFRPSWSADGFLWQLIFAELKREGKNPTQRQQNWLDAVAVLEKYYPITGANGKQIRVDQYVWRPMDWLNGAIQARLAR